MPWSTLLAAVQPLTSDLNPTVMPVLMLLLATQSRTELLSDIMNPEPLLLDAAHETATPPPRLPVSTQKPLPPLVEALQVENSPAPKAWNPVPVFTSALQPDRLNPSPTLNPSPVLYSAVQPDSLAPNAQ